MPETAISLSIRAPGLASDTLSQLERELFDAGLRVVRSKANSSPQNLITKVTPIKGKPGHYRASALLRPHLQVDFSFLLKEIDVWIRSPLGSAALGAVVGKFLDTLVKFFKAKPKETELVVVTFRQGKKKVTIRRVMIRDGQIEDVNDEGLRELAATRGRALKLVADIPDPKEGNKEH